MGQEWQRQLDNQRVQTEILKQLKSLREAVDIDERPQWMKANEARLAKKAAIVTQAERKERQKARAEDKERELSQGPHGWGWFDWAVIEEKWDDLRFGKAIFSWLNSKRDASDGPLIIAGSCIQPETAAAIKRAAEKSQGRWEVTELENDFEVALIPAGPSRSRGCKT